MRLQKRSVDAAAPKDKRYTLWDSDLGGFGCSPACKFDPFVGVIGVEK